MSPLATLALAAALQCTDPSVPPSGFATFELLDLPVTFSDGETTTATLRWPRDPAGPCGWPLVVFIHGLFGSQNGPTGFARDFSEWGYATLTFDVRGHATASGRHTLWGLRERLDVVEIVEWVRTSFPGVVDPGRLGLAGTSQGAILSLGAAAWAGQPIEPNPWTTGTYPEVHAVVVTNLTSDFLSTFAPQSSGLHCNIAGALLGSNSNVRFDYGLVADAARSILDDDPAAWACIVNDPSRNPRPLVPQITTPILAMTAWDDYWFPIQPIVAALDALPASTPRKLYLGTGGHSTPNAQAEIALRDQWRRQWLDRFLKGEPNGVELGPRVTYAQTPADAAAYLSAQTQWPRRVASSWPPTDSREHRLYLRSGGELSAIAPVGNEPDVLLAQHVGAGFGAAELIASEFRLPAIEPEIPRVDLEWRSPPLAGALRIAGDPHVQLSIETSDARWQVAASLWDIDPQGDERYVSSGGYFVHPQTGAAPAQVLVRLGAQSYEFAAGHRIAVRVSNFLVHEPPVGALLRYAPTLHDFTLTLRSDATALSWIDLPVPESEAIPYGWSQVASNGCVARMDGIGTASASSTEPFFLRAEQVIPGRDGLLIYGLGVTQSQLNGGFLWVAAPVKRSPLVSSGGSLAQGACSGALSYDFNPRVQSGVDPALVPGQRLFAQYWYRDPQSPGLTNLTNAVEFSILP